jgi:hypothetical protein
MPTTADAGLALGTGTAQNPVPVVSPGTIASAPFAFLANDLEEGTNGTGITTGNSGGAGENAFDVVTPGTGVTMDYSTGPGGVSAQGSLCMAIVTTSTAAAGYVTWSTSFGTQAGTVYYRLYLNVPAYPSANTLLLQFLAASGYCTRMYLKAAGTLYLTDSGGTQQAITTNAIGTSTWVRVEGFVTPSTSAGQVSISLFLNPASETATETDTSAATLNTNSAATSARLGLQTNTSSYTVYLDALGISTAGYLGPDPPGAGAASAGGTAQPAVPVVITPAVPAAATGTAQPASAGTANAGVASAAGTAQPATAGSPGTANAGLAAAAGTAQNPVPVVTASTAAVVPAPLLANDFEGGTNGTGITTGNSGGAGENAFNVVTPGTGVTVDYSTGPDGVSAQGNLCMAVVTTSTAAAGYVTWSTSFGTQSGTVYYRVYLNVPFYPPGNMLLVEFLASSGYCTRLYMTDSGLLYMTDSNGVQQAITTNAVPVSQWARIEGFVAVSTTTGQVSISLFLNPSSLTPTETDTSAATLTTNSAATSVRIGLQSVLTYYTLYMDAIAVGTGGYLGPDPPGPVVAAAIGTAQPSSFTSVTAGLAAATATAQAPVLAIPAGAGLAAATAVAQSTVNVWYVSPGGNNTTGNSWATAWADTADIEWGSVSAGDYIYLDGGTTTSTVSPYDFNSGSPQPGVNVGQNYSPFTVSTSGVNILRSRASGHNGTVVIFGGRDTPLPYAGQASYSPTGPNPTGATLGIDCSGVTGVTIDGQDRSGIIICGCQGGLKPGTDGGNTFRNLELFDNGYPTTTNFTNGTGLPGGGTYNSDGDNILLAGGNTFDRCLVHDGGQDEFHSDASGTASDASGTVIKNCWMGAMRASPFYNWEPFNDLQAAGWGGTGGTTHADCVQIFYPADTMSGMTVDHCVFGPGTNQGLFPADPNSFNNVTVSNCLFLGAVSNQISVVEPASGWVIENCTIFGPVDAYVITGNGNSVMTNVIKEGGTCSSTGMTWTGSSGNVWWQGTALPSGAVNANPAFVNAPATGTNPPLATLFTANLTPTGTYAGYGSPIGSVAALLSYIDLLNGTNSTFAPATPAGATGTAQPPNPAVTVTAVPAAATGIAEPASVTTSAHTTANAGIANAAGTAQAPYVKATVTATVPAAAAGTAEPATAVISGNTIATAGAASAAGTAQAPVPAVQPNGGLAAGTGTAQGTKQELITATAGLPAAAGTAQQASISSGTHTAAAGVASAAGVAQSVLHGLFLIRIGATNGSLGGPGGTNWSMTVAGTKDNPELTVTSPTNGSAVISSVTAAGEGGP